MKNCIRALRIERGLTQIDLSTAAGITQGCLSQLEIGKREGKANTLLKISHALNVKLGDLFPDVYVDEVSTTPTTRQGERRGGDRRAEGV